LQFRTRTQWEALVRQKVMKLLKEIEARGNAMKVLAIANSLVMLLSIGMLAVGGKQGDVWQ
jgi:hypothetical protein